MKFRLDAVYVEEQVRTSALCRRVLARLGPEVPVHFVTDGREVARTLDGPDPFAAGKRRLVLMKRRAPFLTACPAASAQFACCGYLVLILASNCPMDCSYCFLQEYLADNPAFQIYTNYEQAFDELERLSRTNPKRHFRIGTGELADSLAFDTLTGICPDLIEFFLRHENLRLELKTKTDEIDNLLRLDPKGRVLVSWTLSPMRVFESCERGTALPSARIEAASRLVEAGYRVAFHLDPIIPYPGAFEDYRELLNALFDAVDPLKISFISLGTLRMTPRLRAIARTRHPQDAILIGGEEVLSPDGRYRPFYPLRLKLYRAISEQIRAAHPKLVHYLCMESPETAERVLGSRVPKPAALGELLATT